MFSTKHPRCSSVLSLAVAATALFAACSNTDNNTVLVPSGAGGAVSTMGGATAAATTVGYLNVGGSVLMTAAGGTAAQGTTKALQGGATSAGGSSSAVGGTQSLGGTTGAVATTLWRGPTPATATAKFPFPQNRQSASCIYPANYRNEDVQAIYTKWKTDVVVADGANFRIRRPQEPGLEVNSTVSEGIAYGMIISVYMNDQPLFDGLWKYWLSHTWTCTPTQCSSNTPTTLMNWYILANGTPGTLPGGTGPSLGAATDADEDAAWALIMADKQWGGSGSLAKTYLQSAKDLLKDIWNYEIFEGKLPRNGSSWGDWKDLNISYFAPSEYRAFFTVDPSHAWVTDVVKTAYDTIGTNLTAARGNQSNGLVPAWTQSSGADITATDRPKHYQYDSCRTPFRIGLDACFNNEPRAVDYVAKTSSFFAGLGASKIVTGYDLNGTPRPEFAGQSSSFVGTAGVGAMHSATYQTFVNDAYNLIRQNNMNVGGLYYDESWAMMTILMMTGNYLDYTKY